MKLGKIASAAILFAIVSASPAAAADYYLFFNSPTGTPSLKVNGSTTINAFQTGWFDSNGSHFNAVSNYWTGFNTYFGATTEYRSFFSFQPTGTIASGALTIGNALSGGYYNATGGPLELTLYDVSRSIVWLQQYNGKKDYFEDLGSGTVLGKILIDGAASSYTIGLNEDGVRAFNAAYAQRIEFTVGARLTTAPIPPSGVPEPASWAMMLGGFGLLGGALRARRRTAVTYV
ncbi:PEPxxWA-CTERM sorting domain-containing protein [Sphingomonas azotifigens]|uniref:PEPxxWA-CTERM sorting domain-containing protein n=1 Tax=Sphingomonas azotifigens TaxID=330920 RepID=UPI0009FF1AE2|nr:PEPxxWA-CTERM sorting domain-containing protein [Sphingomonas azotifigens]